MKFLSFVGFFGGRWRGRRPAARVARRRPRRAPFALWLESLERREMLSGNPTIVSVTPADGSSVTTTNHPDIKIVFSEKMVVGGANNVGIDNKANYILFDREGNPVPIDSATVTDSPNNTTVDLGYNGGADLNSDTYTLYVRGDRLTDVADGLSVAPKGQVVAANATSGLVSVASFNGDGTLAAPGYYQIPNLQPGNVQAAPTQVATGDFNGDGIPDLAVLEAGTNRVAIYAGRTAANGGGYDLTPSLMLNLPGSASPQDALIAVDLNKDGKPDIAVANFNAGNVSVFLNTSSGPGVLSFSPGTAYAAGRNPDGIAAGSFLGNGNIDLVVSNATNNAGNFTINYLPSTGGNGTFGAAVAVTVGTTGPTLLQNPSALVVAPFTASGLPDILVGGSNGTLLVTNTSANGAIAFTAGTALASNRHVNYLAAGRVQAGPGRADAAASEPGNLVELLLNNGAGVFTSQTVPVPAGAGGNLLIRDLNNDNLADIVVANGSATAGAVTVLKNTSTAGTVSFAAFPGSPLASDLNPVGVALADTNQDKFLDLIIANQGSNDFTLYQGNGDGTFRTGTNYTAPTTGLAAVAIGDVNGDGINDIVTINNTNQAANSAVFIYLGNADGTYQAPITFSPGGGLRSLNSVLLADLNGDGKLDIIVTDQQDSTLGILVNETTTPASPTFVAVTPLAVGAAPVQVVAADFNGDGRLDLAVAHNQVGTPNSLRGVTILRNTGNDAGGLPQFFAGFEVASGIPAGGIAVADFNKDGKPDFVVTENTAPGSIELFLNSSSGGGGISFADGGNFATGVTDPGPVAVADFNADGFPDLVVASGSTAQATGGIAVLLNQLGSGFGTAQVTAVLPGTALDGLAVADVNLDGLPDIIVSVLPGGGGQKKDNFFVLTGTRSGGFGALTPYLAGKGPDQDPPTYLATTGSPLVRVTTFNVGGTVVNVNISQNGDFEAPDLSGETGNIIGWQTYDLPSNPGGSHGQWAIQSGLNSSLSGVPVPGPTSGNFEAMLDEADMAPVLPGTSNTNTPDSYAGSHALYQDITLPANVSNLTLSLSLYIDNSNSGFLSIGGFTDTTLTPTLDYRTLAANQQVRIDIMDPTAPGFNILGTTAATGVLRTEFLTNANSLAIIQTTITDDLKAFAGKTVRLRIASANNRGKLIVAIDNVQIQAKFVDGTPPVLQKVRLSNPGFLGSPDGKTPHTSDPTIAGQALVAGGVKNIAFIDFDPLGDGFGGPDDRKIGPDAVDALGNFSFTIPDLTPGLNTVGVEVVDKAGNKTATSITFFYQPLSTAAFQGSGPGAIDTTPDPTVTYGAESGRITATVTDSTDPTGNTYLVGTPNGGIWRTTDGGASWTPVTNGVTDGKGHSVPTPIGAMAQSRSNPNVWYAGLGVADLQLDSHTGSGVIKSTDDGLTWTLVGGNSATLAGARIAKIVIDGNNPNTVYAAVASGGSSGPGVYKSTDGGQTWTDVLVPTAMYPQNFAGPAFPAGTPLASVTDLEIDPFNSNRLLVGLGNIGLVGSSVSGGVWRTTNQGGTWDLIFGGDNPAIPNDTLPQGAGVGRVTIALGSGRVGDEANVYVLVDNPPPAFGLIPPGYNAGSYAGLYKTKDNLLNFTKVMLREDLNGPGVPHNFVNISVNGVEGSNFNALLVDPTNPNVVYVGGSMRYSASPITTHAFIRVDTGDMRDTTYLNVVGQIPNDGDSGTAANTAELPPFKAAPIDGTPGVYDPNPPFTPGNTDPYKGEGVYWYDLLEGAGNNTGGLNSLPNAITSLAFDDKGRLVVGTVAGVYRGTGTGFGYDFTSGGFGIMTEVGISYTPPPGMTFTSINGSLKGGSLQIGDLTSVAIDPTHPGTLYTTQFDGGSSGTTAGSLSWVTQNLLGPGGGGFPTSGTVRAASPSPTSPPDAPTILFRVWQFAAGGGYIPEISQDSGRTWLVLPNNGINQTGNTAGFFPALAVNPVPVLDSGLFEDEILLGTNRVYLTRTTTNVWDPISPVLSKRNSGIGTISALTFTAKSGAYYAATDQGEVFFTQNNGADLWPERDTGLPQIAINTIVSDPANYQIAYAMFNGGKNGEVWRTTNAGLTWVNITANLPAVGAHGLVVDHSPGLGAPQGKLYIGTDAGVYFSNNNGASWAPLSAGMPAAPVSDMQFNAGSDVLAVATVGRGAFSLSTAAVSPIPNQTIPEDKPSRPIPFSINENGIADNKISVTVTSSNQTLVPNAAIQITGTGPDRNLIITPAQFQFGTTTITVTASDGTNSFTSSFTLTVSFVNHPPTITAIANQIVPPNTVIGPLAFTVGDAPTETPPSQLVVTAHSSNQAVVPDANIVLGGSGANRTATITPASATALGAATISLTVADTNGGVTTVNFAVLFTSPVTLPFADNFNRPDNFFLGSGWVQNVGDLANVSNAAAGTTANDVATLQGVSATNVLAQTDVVLASSGVQYAGLVARYSGPGDTNMYWGALVGINGKFEADIFRNVNGTWTELASNPFANGSGTLRFEVAGPSLKLFVNNVLVTFASDTLLAGPGTVGLRANAGNTMDNFSSNVIALTNVTLPFSDNFTRADGQLGPNWLDQLGEGAVKSNALVTSVIDPNSPDPTKSLALETVNGVSNANVAVQADIALGATGVQYTGLVARYAGPGDQNMYWGAVVGVNGAFQAVLFRNVNGTWTQLNPFTPLATGTGTLRFEVVGPSLKLFLNNALVAYASDTVLTAAGTVGLRSSNAITLHNFSAAVLTLNNVTLPFTDNFTRADGQLGPNWLDQLGEGAVKGNALVTSVSDPTSPDPARSVALETLSGVSNANVAVQADVALGTTGLQYTGLVARYAGPGDTNMYWGTVVGNNGSFQAVIFRNVGGTWTQLNPFTPLATGTGTLRFEVVGPSLKLFLNNTLVAFASDTALTAAGTVGLRSSNAITLHNFSAAVLTLNNVTLPFTDNFTRADGQLGPNWLDQLGEGAVSSNALVTSVSDPNSADPARSVALETLNGVSNANVAVQADVALGTTGLQYTGLVARYAGPGDTNMYWGTVVGNNGSFQAVIFRNVNGTWTQLNPFTPLATGTGTLRFEVVGPSLKLFLNNTLVAFASDTALTAAGTVGLRSSNAITLHNFSAAVLTLNNVTLPFSDNFSTAVNQQLSNNWLNQTGNYQVAGGVATGVGPVSVATLNGLNAADVTVQSDVTVATTGLSYGGVVARYSGQGDQNMYWGALVGNNGSYEVVIFVNVNGTWTLLAATAVSSNTGTLKFKVTGTALQLTFGTTTLNATDNQLTSGTAGLRGSAGVTYGNFSAM